MTNAIKSAGISFAAASRIPNLSMREYMACPLWRGPVQPRSAVIVLAARRRGCRESPRMAARLLSPADRKRSSALPSYLRQYLPDHPFGTYLAPVLAQ